MYHITEKNERQSRSTAIVLAVALHLALAAVIYLQTSEPIQKPSASTVSVGAKTPARPVNMP